MATSPTKTDIALPDSLRGANTSAWPPPDSSSSAIADELTRKPTPLDALQALLAFSALHDQVRRRKALAARHHGFDSETAVAEFDPSEQFVLDEVLQLVAERAVAITGADGLAIALAENNEIVLRAAAGTVRPDVGQRIDRDSAFSGACFRTAQVVNCDDTEVDPRVNVQSCRNLGARSMVAVPLCGRRRVIGVLEAFSSWPFGFNDSDVRNLTLLAELVVSALKPEDEDRFAESAQVAALKLEPVKPVAAPPVPPIPVVAAPVAFPPVKPAATAEPAKPKQEPELPKAPTASATPAPLASKPEPTKETGVPQVSPQLRDLGTKPAVETKAALEAKPAPESKTNPDPAPAPAPETQPEPALTFGQAADQAPSRRWIPILVLLAIVVAAAAAVGIWWKLNNMQIGSAIVHNQPAPLKPVNPAPAQQAPTSIEPAVPAPDITTSPTDAENSPATPQELAKFPRVTSVRHWSSADSSTVVLDLEDQVQYEPGHVTNPERYYFDLRDTQLVPDLQNKSFDGDALLSRIRVAQPVAGMTRIVLEARPGTTLAQPQVSLERDPYRFVIEVTRAGARPKGAVNLFPSAPETEKKVAAIVIPPPTREDLQLRARVPKMKIVVDAGHGGWDLGTVGRRGLLEKDLVLEIAERLGKLLESRLGAEIIYTRQDDNYIPLDSRAEIANQAQADLFVSVHANYSDLPSARGVETYYSNFFSAPGSKDLAPNAKPLGPALSAVDLHERIEQSRRLAASVQRSLYGTLSVSNPGLRDRGIKEAGFVVLTESAMPGILAEVSFVSSPTDEQRLRSDGYREQIAEALYRGIARYAATSRNVKVASAK